MGTPAAGAVSAADLVALAGARAVRITGGPAIDVPIGGQPKHFVCAAQARRKVRTGPRPPEPTPCAWRSLPTCRGSNLHVVANCSASKQVELSAGRRDAAGAGPADRLPAETMDAATQRAAFAAKALSCQEMVALLGAHTVRAAKVLHCLRFAY